jgi:hypothetical protein
MTLNTNFTDNITNEKFIDFVQFIFFDNFL